MTALATYPPSGHGVAALDTRLQLGLSEPLPVGVKRVTMEQLEIAASGFFEGEVAFPGAVHEARKAVKRVRAILRLVEGDLPPEVFHYENQSLREVARRLAELRAAAALTETAQVLREIYGELLAPGTFEELVARLGHRRDLLHINAMEDPKLVTGVVRDLERAHSRYSTWPTQPGARKVYGLGIRGTFAALGPGLEKTYTRGRRAMVVGYRTRSPVDLHAWRKRVKDLRHQMEFLVPVWPEVVSGVSVTLAKTGELLGDDHDLAELAELLGHRPDLCPNPRERSLLYALVRQRRHELELAAEILGRRVYAEKPGSMTRRFDEYWATRQLAITETPEAFVIY